MAQYDLMTSPAICSSLRSHIHAKYSAPLSCIVDSHLDLGSNVILKEAVPDPKADTLSHTLTVPSFIAFGTLRTV